MGHYSTATTLQEVCQQAVSEQEGRRQITRDDHTDRVNGRLPTASGKITNTVYPAWKLYTPLLLPVKMNHCWGNEKIGQQIIPLGSRDTKGSACFNTLTLLSITCALSVIGKCDFPLGLSCL